MPKPLTWIAAVVLAAGTVAAQQPAGLTLAAALDRANSANPEIVAARARRAVDIANVDVAHERPNPDLLFEAARDTPREALTLTLPFELGGKRARRVDVAKATLSTTEAEIDQTIAGVQNDVRRAYFQALASERMATLADETRALALRARDTAKARLDAGDVAQADVAQTEFTLAAADDDVLAAKGEAAATRIELSVLLGQPAATSLTFADDLAAGAVPTVEGALAEATSGNRELQVMDRRIAEETARRNLASAQRTPDINIGGGITFNAQPDFSTGWRASAGITLPLFTTHKAGVAVEDAELSRLRAEREALVARISGAVAAAATRASSMHERLAHFQTDTLPRIADVERYAQASYSGGQTPLAPLIQALQQTRDARKAGVTAALEFQLALADLEKAIGR